MTSSYLGINQVQAYCCPGGLAVIPAIPQSAPQDSIGLHGRRQYANQTATITTSMEIIVNVTKGELVLERKLRQNIVHRVWGMDKA